MENSSSPPIGAVLVVGGGISGIQASLDLGALGYKVYLVESSPMIGGKMAQLDKTFPTCDCSMCILSPKMIECERHPNIDILTYAEVNDVDGEAGNFQVTLAKKPRYVREDLCVGCRACSSYCPVSVPDPFNEDLSSTKAISVFCPQAVPSVSVVNADQCLFLKETKCKICQPVCKQGAIDFTQHEKETTVQVGAIVATTGYDLFDAALATEYGYGRMPNVVTSMDFERLLNADGPHHGEVLRPSDGTVPRKIAWLQCVGSRSRKYGHTYCSAVCCEYAVKQVVLAKDHYPDVQATVFYNDMRAFGKGWEDFCNRAEEMDGVRFIRKRISAIKENKKTNNLMVTFVSEDHDRDIQKEEFDMIVLSVGMVPSKDNASLARIMGLDLNEHGFCHSDYSSTNATTRPGIYPAATITGPMDIPDAISSSTGAVSAAAQLLSSQRGSLARARSFPAERAVEGAEARVGVFVCRCGANIGRVVDVPSVVHYASTLKNVAYAEENLFSCSADAGRHIAETIKDKGLNRVVVAACTPRTHEPLFQDTLREAGINKYLFELANIREHCSWVHSREKEKATEKAKDTVRMAVERARNLAPLEEIEVPVIPKGLILGGGLAGMTASLSLARQGFKVYLVEKENELGGNLRNLHYTMDGLEVPSFFERLKTEIENQENIKVLKGYALESLSGSVGNFMSKVTQVGQGKEDSRLELEHGIIIVATGGKEHKPTEYRYGESDKILTQQELEAMIHSDSSVKNIRQVAMIQCVGARNKERPYCGRICCGEAIKNALKLKELNQDIEILIFHRDIRTYGLMEDYYNLAREKGIVFIRYEPERKPEVSTKGEGRSLTFLDPVLNMEGEIAPDLVVLSTPVVSEQNQELSQLLRVPVTDDGFFMEAHMKLRPFDFATEGIFLCGMAHYPKYIPETTSQANGAAVRAASILCQEAIKSSGIIAEVEEETCIGCGMCESICPYSAFSVHEGADGPKAILAAALCRGCGTCIARCPKGAISLNHCTDSQVIAQIAAVA